ncbi:NUDIX hydrolase [Candidatus Woesearchaeota archaeon CG07_land_8_20_14_0_80_44_23]|nr:MAG: NUDIX hydrolase [Candidatus Woesearchaeota archaeon CG07_land_8_20_14_0_80_44_23]
MYKKNLVFVTVDMVLFTIQNKELHVLLIRRALNPFRGLWALPGGFLRPEEELETAAKRELYEETGVKNAFLAQLYTKGDIGRDPRGRVITVIYYSLMDSAKVELRASTDAAEVSWFSVKNLPKLAFDHERIIRDSAERIRNKIEYTNIAFQLLPQKFTLSELQSVYETILDRTLDKRNFRKKVNEINALKKLTETKMQGIHRPARLYAFLMNKKESVFSPRKKISG